MKRAPSQGRLFGGGAKFRIGPGLFCSMRQSLSLPMRSKKKAGLKTHRRR
jgi:hypothetical protein